MENKKTIRLRKNDIELLAALRAHLETLPEPMPTIEALSKKFGINTDKLKKGFKFLYGEPPLRYLFLLKIEKAKIMLAETELSVNEIAWELGYEHPSNFCTQFRKVTGMSAGVWRKKGPEET